MNKPKPFFSDPYITIVVIVDVESFPYFCVMLQSMIEHVKDSMCYDIIVFHKGITKQMQQNSYPIVSKYENVCLRFIDCIPLATKVEWVKLFLPFIMEKYSKILCLDAQFIFLDDIAKIADMQFANNKMIYAVSNMEHGTNRRPNVCSEMLWMDAHMYRRMFSYDFIRKSVLENSRQANVCDMLNSLWFKKIGYLDLKELNILFYKNNSFLDLEQTIGNRGLFWSYARKSRYYELIMERAVIYTIQNQPELAKDIGIYRDTLSDVNRIIKALERREIGFYWISVFMKVWLKNKIISRYDAFTKNKLIRSRK